MKDKDLEEFVCLYCAEDVDTFVNVNDNGIECLCYGCGSIIEYEKLLSYNLAYQKYKKTVEE